MRWRVFLLLLPLFLGMGCDNTLPCVGFECELSGKWNITHVDDASKNWGVLEVYQDLTGGRLTLYQDSGAMLMRTAYGGGYWGDDQFNLSLWNMTMPDGNILSFEAYVDAWTKTSFTLRMIKSPGQNSVEMLKFGRVWKLTKQAD